MELSAGDMPVFSFPNNNLSKIDGFSPNCLRCFYFALDPSSIIIMRLLYNSVTRIIIAAKQYLFVFVCVEVLRPSQPNGVMSSAVSLPNQWLSWMRRLTGDQKVAGSTPAEVGNILSWLNPRPSGLQSDGASN